MRVENEDFGWPSFHSFAAILCALSNGEGRKEREGKRVGGLVGGRKKIFGRDKERKPHRQEQEQREGGKKRLCA